VKLVHGLWNDEFLRVLENFPAAKHDDEVDALSRAYEQIGGRGAPFECERVAVRRNLIGLDSAFGTYRERWSARESLPY
jgi:hypothetical protein